MSQESYQGILQLAADTPEQLRPGDVDRLLCEASMRGILEEFKTWLLSCELGDRTREVINEWEEEEE